MQNTILVIGGSNIDHIATCEDIIVSEDSNPSIIETSYGGVGRNIYENLLRLNCQANFITALGKDVYGQAIYSELTKLGGVVYFPVIEDNNFSCNTASYLAICNKDGSLYVASCDEAICKYLTIDYLTNLNELIKMSDYIVIDGNLDEEVIKYLIKTYQDKYIIVDATSKIKALKFKDLLPYINLLKVNKLEAEAILNVSNEEDDVLLEGFRRNKVQNVILTRGHKNILYYHDFGITKSFEVKPIKNVVSVIGAGDALLAGIISQIQKGVSFNDAIRFGNELAGKTCLTKGAVYNGNE